MSRREAAAARRPGLPPPIGAVLLAWVRAALLRPGVADDPPARGVAALRALDRRVVAGLVMVTVGVWLLAVTLAGERAADPLDDIPANGLVRVDRVVDTAEAGVPAGSRRVTLNVTLVAGPREPMRYAGDKFGLSVGGEQLSPFRVDLPGDTLRPRSQLSGQLVFDVPAATATAALTLGGRPLTTVDVPVAGAAR
ncbi:hypothetical protein [Pilimelia terevasa]|uniref:hypothetical protein n=1 Tax=Pilimelia terevasa TaxID=53372 RepID=UPI00166A8B96|nr:hypothetical protein [Pilimelia terevasa]